MRRGLVFLLLLCAPLAAQMPKGFYAWWGRPEIRKDLKLSNEQQRQIRATVTQFRPHLIELRAEVNKAEIDLAAQFDHDPVDQAKADQAIEHLIAARSDLTRTLSQLSLRLRVALTEEQWQQLQRLRPAPGQGANQPNEYPQQK
ncbi:MAG TPA: periplasmic heavy metal sensor [Bryobacteraceae bacterium]|nr:periplasmic heavy metal sensor [Bryobacteraceae bacterium]